MKTPNFTRAALVASAFVLSAAVIGPPAFAQTQSGGRIGGGLAADGLGDRTTGAPARRPGVALQSAPLGVPLSAPTAAPSQSQQRMNERMNEGRVTSQARTQADDEARARAQREMSPPTGTTPRRPN